MSRCDPSFIPSGRCCSDQPKTKPPKVGCRRLDLCGDQQVMLEAKGLATQQNTRAYQTCLPFVRGAETIELRSHPETAAIPLRDVKKHCSTERLDPLSEHPNFLSCPGVFAADEIM